MLLPRVFVPSRPLRGSRIRRAVVATAAGALLVLGAACNSSAAIEDSEAGDQPIDGAANIGDSPSAEPAVLVASASSEVVEDASAPALPDWVVAKLEAGSPTLVLSYPAEGATVSDSYIQFSGKAEPGSTVAAGPYETKADASGQWSIGLVLSEGQNVATFTATSEDGVETKQSVTVHFKPHDSFVGKYDGTKDGTHAIDFQAWQKYGTCSETIPYDVFKGKATPGTTISVSSQYGSGTVIAGDDGYWKKKVTFEAAPVGQEFTVTVSDGAETKTFTFTRTA